MSPNHSIAVLPFCLVIYVPENGIWRPSDLFLDPIPPYIGATTLSFPYPLFILLARRQFCFRFGPNNVESRFDPLQHIWIFSHAIIPQPSKSKTEKRDSWDESVCICLSGRVFVVYQVLWTLGQDLFYYINWFELGKRYFFNSMDCYLYHDNWVH